MRILPLSFVLLASLAGPWAADAAPVGIQGEQQEQEPALPPREIPVDQDRNEPQQRPQPLDSFSSVFDSDGLPMLHVSAPTYLYLGARRKLRQQDFNGPTDGGNGGGGGDNGDGDDGDGGGDTPPIIPPDPRPVPEPAAMLMLVPAAVLAIRKSRRGKSPRA